MMHEECKSFCFHDWLNWKANEVYDYEHYGRDEKLNERKWSYDPIDLLPVDPFEMNLETTLFEMDLGTKLSAAIAGWIGGSNDDYEVNSDAFVSDLSYYWNNEVLSSFETQLNPGCQAVDFCNSFSGLVFDTGEANFGAEKVPIYSTSDATHTVLGMRDDIHTGGEGSSVPEGLILSLGYLGVQDLLSVERVCRSLHTAVQSDTLLWRCIQIDTPLSEKLTDDGLFQLTQRAQGNLQSLSLMGCPRITDTGLKRVLGSNLKLKKLSVPGCLRLSVNGLINSLKDLKLPAIKTLKLGSLFIASPKQFGELRSLLVGTTTDELLQSKAHKLKFYHNISCQTHDDDDDDEDCIDIELCPICRRYRLVFDCPLEGCRKRGAEQCRACNVCIPRCQQCGRCINNCEYMETFCLEFVCLTCWRDVSNEEEMLLLEK